MPELPEVETVRRDLARVMVGHRVKSVTVNRHRLRDEIPPMFAERLKGQKTEAIERRGKYILIRLSDYTWITHLGMSGRILSYPASDYLPLKHDHVSWLVGDTVFAFNDPRRFGNIDLIKKGEVYEPLKNMGPEPFEITADDFFKRLRKTARPLKTALLDQTVIAGLGNIYVCEALWQSGLSPLKAANTVTEAQAAELLRNVREVLNQAIMAGGSSLKDYRKIDNSVGDFQRQFKVYDRLGKPCATYKCSGTIDRVTQSGRSTFYCPSCQKI